MAGLGDALISVGADVSQFEDDLAGALENALGKNKFVQIMATSAAAGVSAAIAAFVPLEKKLLEIFQVGGVAVTDELFDTLAGNVLEIAKRVGKPAEEVGSAISLGLGRGFSLQSSEQIADVAGRLSVALGQDLEPAAKGVTAAINGFGLAAKDTERVAGVLFQTVSKSGIPMESLAQQIGNIAPAAATAGIKLEDVAAAVTTMVQSGVSAAESTTQLRTLITELSRASSDGGKVFQSIAGKTFPEFIKQGGSLQEALRLIRTAADKSGYSVQELTGNYNTANAVIATTGENTKRYTQNLLDNKKGVEDLADAVNTAESGTLRKFQRAFNDIRTSVQEVGTAIRPLITQITDKITGGMGGASDAISAFALKIQSTDFTPLIDMARNFGDLILSIWDLMVGLDWAGIGSAVVSALQPVGAALYAASEFAGMLADAINQYVAPAAKWLTSNMELLEPAIAAVVAAFIAWRTVLAIQALITAVTAAVGGLTAGFWGLTAAMTANPVGAVIALLAALGFAFMVAWQKSETFRQIVESSLNGVLWVVGNVVAESINAFKLLVRTLFEAVLNPILHAIDILNKAWGALPFTDNAKAEENSRNLANFRAEARNWISELDVWADKARNLSVQLNVAANAARNLSALEEMAEYGWSNKYEGPTADQIAAEEAQRKLYEAFQKNTPKLPNLSPATGGLDDLINPKKTKKAAAKIKDNLTKMIIDIYRHIVKLGKNATKMSVSQIQSSFESIIGKYNKAIEHAIELGKEKWATRLKGSLKQFKRFESQLVRMAKARDVLDEKLTDAKDALADIKTEAKSFRDAMKAAFVDIGAVSEASDGIGVTFRGIRNNMRDAIRTTESFDKAMRQLQALNLNEASLRQLAEAGPEALDQARALVRSGAAGVKEINILQNRLEEIAGSNAKNLTSEFYSAGISAAEGLVKGLQSQRSKIIKEMQIIANEMVKAARKSLGIKSPSTVFDDLYSQVPAGAAQGVRRGIPELVKAVDAMAAASARSSANFGAGSVQINGVSDPAAAQRAGILAGEAIQYTLERRRTAQRLAGVG